MRRTAPKSVWFLQKRLCLLGICLGVCGIAIWWLFGWKEPPIPDTSSVISISEDIDPRFGLELVEKSQQNDITAFEPSAPSEKNFAPVDNDRTISSALSEKEICAEVDKLISGRKFTEALQLVTGYLEKDLPATVRERVLLYKGNLLFAMGERDIAYKVYDQLLLEGKREDVRGWSVVKLYALARLLDRIDETLTAYQNRHEMQPYDTRLTATLADFYAYHRQPDKEIEFRTRLLNDDSANIENAMKLIAAYQQLKKPTEAAEVCSRLAKTDTNNEAAYLLRQARFLYEAQDKDNAIRVCDAVFQSTSANDRNLLHCGYLYEQLGLNQQAINAFDKGAKIAAEQYRQERCLVESLRVKQLQEKLSSSECSALEQLAQNARAPGVRNLAKTILDKSK